MHVQHAYASRNRKLEDRTLAQRTLVQPPPHKERALWNFLTWSFFLAQVLAAEQFIGARANAAESPDLKAPESTAALAASDLQSLAVPDGTIGAVDDVRSGLSGGLDDVFGQSVKLGDFGGSAIDIDYAALAQREDFSQSISAGGYGGTDAGPSLSGDTPVDLVVDVVVPDILEVIGDVTGPLLETVEDIVATLTGIVGGITDPLLDTVGNIVHVVDDLLEPVTDLVADLTQPLGDVVHDVLTPVTALLGNADDLGSTAQGVLASAGQLTLPILELAGLDDIFNDGRYTDYGIELHTNATALTEAIADVTASAASTATEAVDHVVESAMRPLDDAGRHLAHLLDDLGAGGLADRLL